jgi:hypothetical protein
LEVPYRSVEEAEVFVGEIAFAVTVSREIEGVMREMTRTLTEELREKYSESRRAMGIHKVRTFLQIRDDEMMLIFYVEADDPQEAVRLMSQERSGINYYLNDIYDRYVDEDPRTKAARSQIDLIFAWDA